MRSRRTTHSLHFTTHSLHFITHSLHFTTHFLHFTTHSLHFTTHFLHFTTQLPRFLLDHCTYFFSNSCLFRCFYTHTSKRINDLHPQVSVVGSFPCMVGLFSYIQYLLYVSFKFHSERPIYNCILSQSLTIRLYSSAKATKEAHINHKFTSFCVSILSLYFDYQRVFSKTANWHHLSFFFLRVTVTGTSGGPLIHRPDSSLTHPYMCPYAFFKLRLTVTGAPDDPLMHRPDSLLTHPYMSHDFFFCGCG